MAEYDVAHIKQQGQDLIIVPMDSAYGSKPNAEQNTIRDALAICAQSAGLAGGVVTVWDARGGRMGFLAPPEWQLFFGSIGLPFLRANINRRLTCG